MPLIDELSRLGSGSREAHAKNHIVKSGFEQKQEILTRYALGALRQVNVVAKLLFQNAI
jgi:hypothetical protein